MRDAAKVALLSVLVIIGAALMLFFIVADRVRRVIDRLMNGPDI